MEVFRAENCAESSAAENVSLLDTPPSKNTSLLDVLPFVSVIVPVFDDAARLVACLDALKRQTYPADRFEILVVDNGSKTSLRTLGLSGRGLRILEEPRAGSYVARNRGIEASRGEILAFTDADCLPRPEWLARGVDQFRDRPDLSVLGGRIHVVPNDEARPTLAERHQLALALDQLRCLKIRYAITANLLVRRRVFETVGLFHSQLKSTGDLEWGQRAASAGFLPEYAPEAIVVHPARRRLRDLISRSARIAGGHFLVGQERGQSTFRVASLGVRGLLSNSRRIWRHPSLSTTRHRLGVLLVEIALRAVGIAELARLSLGGTPRRR